MKHLARFWPAPRARGPVALLAPLALFVALNVLALAIAYFAGLPRGFLINLDFAVPAILLAAPITGRSSLHPRLIISVALFVLCAIDLAAFSTRFYVTADAITDMARFISLWPWKILFPIILTLTLFSAVMARSLPLPARPAALGVLIGFLALAAALDVASGRNRFFQTGDVQFPNVMASATLIMADPIFRSLTSPQIPPTQISDTFATDIDVPPSRVLSIALESIGVFRDPRAQAAIMAPLIEGLDGEYRVQVSTSHEYRGGTLSGEIRELCGLQTLSLVREDTAFKALRNCLPARLARAGYETTAVHGNDAAFYTRSRVYPAMGFQHTLFKEELIAAGASRCREFIFEGVCDHDVFQRAIGIFKPGGRQFVHVMTLDNHFPLPRKDVDCTPGHTRQEISVCVYSAHARRLMGALADEIRASSTKPDLIVVYGDHMPPFNEPVRSRFEPAQVPYIELRRIQR
ncbi:sulfatase-like hydrolase/transferase [Brevundimonas sp.]|uniref:sulfatase-like hydrolase/transferase n=1 Tax=Brevundimonas sp. TaxID=1871086 RepID=UPI003A922604